MTLVHQSTLLLVSTLAFNLLAIGYIARRGDDGFRIRLLILLNYMVDNVISGLVHVLGLSEDRGFYEALSGNPPGAGSGLMTASWAALLGLTGLFLGTLAHRRGVQRDLVPESKLVSWPSHRRGSALALSMLMLAVCGLSWIKVRSVTADVNGRIIAVGGGNARFVTLAGWLQWAVTLLVLTLLARQKSTRNHIWNAFVMLFSLALIVITQAWSGGRSTLLFAVLPLLAIVLPFTGKVKWPMLGIGGGALGAIIWLLTLQRAEQSAGSTDMWGLVDWQWGRFSMGAWAARYVEEHGSVQGETFLSSLLALPDALLHFVGIALPLENIRSMVEITGASLRGSNEMIFIVPGLTAELILNFGLVGVFVGYYLLGRLAAMLADRFRYSVFEMERVLIVFIATVVCFSTIVAAAEAFFLTLFMDGLPLVALAIWERWEARRTLASDSAPRSEEAALLQRGH
ncbi:hypothetical protein ACTQ49_07040 [Luteococcus sp. Sow4_B9]|uniref:hypothetical protein n=1 Tax=Luteococcus sp. Sow4_B9 TaxID=3438792 RepID=UPI003F945374